MELLDFKESSRQLFRIYFPVKLVYERMSINKQILFIYSLQCCQFQQSQTAGKTEPLSQKLSWYKFVLKHFENVLTENNCCYFDWPQLRYLLVFGFWAIITTQERASTRTSYKPDYEIPLQLLTGVYKNLNKIAGSFI